MKIVFFIIVNSYVSNKVGLTYIVSHEHVFISEIVWRFLKAKNFIHYFWTYSILCFVSFCCKYFYGFYGSVQNCKIFIIISINNPKSTFMIVLKTVTQLSVVNIQTSWQTNVRISCHSVDFISAKLSYKHDLQTWLTNMTYKYDLQTWLTNMTYKYDLQTWLTNMTYEHDLQTWLTNMTYKHDLQTWLTNITHKHDLQTWLTWLLKQRLLAN